MVELVHIDLSQTGFKPEVTRWKNNPECKIPKLIETLVCRLVGYTMYSWYNDFDYSVLVEFLISVAAYIN